MIVALLAEMVHHEDEVAEIVTEIVDRAVAVAVATEEAEIGIVAVVGRETEIAEIDATKSGVS